MSYKIVFFDIDGTLVDEQNRMPESTIRAINKVRANGLEVVLATGRSPVHIQEVAKTLDIDAYICCNGSIARYEGEKVHSESIPQDTVQQLVEKAEEKNHPLIKFTENNCYSNIEIAGNMKTSFQALWKRMPSVAPDIWQKEDIYQAYLYCEEAEQKKYEELHPHLRFTRWFSHTVDVNDRFMNKAVGIERMLHHLDIAPEASIAFGDNKNDLEMLSYVGMGVAMGNAIEETKSKADFVTKALHEDGISYALEELKVI